MKIDWLDEKEVLRLVMRELKLNADQAGAWLEDAVHRGFLTPKDLTEAERPHWKCWRNLN
ncbi:MAG TPA: hypothetical protein VFR19_25300 [Hyphomicrobiaceae bacterium]|jgi:hypothetical protein|nr:hypothetical protein [Hyphomicrobiaceae bacterium]